MHILAGANYLDAGWPYSVNISFTHAFFHETLDALNKFLRRINFAMTKTKCRNVAQKFTELRQSLLEEESIAALDVIALKILQRTSDDTQTFESISTGRDSIPFVSKRLLVRTTKFCLYLLYMRAVRMTQVLSNPQYCTS